MRQLLAAAIVLGLAALALGDVVHFKNGGSIEGKVVPTDTGVTVKLPAGEVHISKDAIARIEQKPTALDEYEKRAAKLKQDDAEAHYKLGLWAQGLGLKPQAKTHLLRAVALEPDHAAAHKALGHRLVNGKWMSEDEEMKARGLVKFDGQWMPPEAAAKLKTLKAELEVAREKRLAAEAELKRVQEQAKAAANAPAADMPVYGPNPYDQYYSTRQFRDSRTYYWAPPYNAPYYTGHGGWWYYPNDRRHHTPRPRR